MIVNSFIKIKETQIFPELFLGIVILYLILYGLFMTLTAKKFSFLIQTALVHLSFLCILLMIFLLLNDSLLIISFTNYNYNIINDYLSSFSKILISFSVLLYLIYIKKYLKLKKINRFEYSIIILFSVLGLILLCSANDLLISYLVLELQGFAFYILAAFIKSSSYSIHSGLKYFILSSLASSLFIYSASIIYGLTGTLNFDELKYLVVLNFFEKNYINLLQFLLLFVLISLFFKLALAPFHIWVPDIYEGAPMASTFFFAVIPKLSVFILMFRIFYVSFYNFLDNWKFFTTLMAVFSIIIGSIAGLEQRKLKSLLAYSSVSHMGYLLVIFSTGFVEAIQMLLGYFFVYMLTGICIWVIFTLIELKKIYNKKQNKDLANLVLLKKSNSMLAFILAILFLSLAGLPPLVGFIVKVGLFLTLVEASMYFIALISMVFSVISTFYYLRIIKLLYFEPVLTGCLYNPIKIGAGFILVNLFYLFFFIFINPTLFYLFCCKINLMFL